MKPGDSGSELPLKKGDEMTLTAKMDRGNGAFGADCSNKQQREEMRNEETARLLTEMADHVRSGLTAGIFKDWNGNKVGSWKATR
jgi:hypothetical protein